MIMILYLLDPHSAPWNISQNLVLWTPKSRENLSFSLGMCQHLALTVAYIVSGRFPPGSQAWQIWSDFSKPCHVHVVSLVNNLDENGGTTPYTHTDPHAKDTRDVWDPLHKLPVQLTSQCCLHGWSMRLKSVAFCTNNTCLAHHHLSLKPSQVSWVISTEKDLNNFTCLTVGNTPCNWLTCHGKKTCKLYFTCHR